MKNLKSIYKNAPLSPLDGRYKQQVEELSEFFSEAALNIKRIEVEIKWFIKIANLQIAKNRKLSTAEVDYLNNIWKSFSKKDLDALAKIEAVTVHDVKAIEYFLQEQFDKAVKVLGNETILPNLKELIHFGATSEDINNLSYALLVKQALSDSIIPAITELKQDLVAFSLKNASVPMLARTHGQTATPTTIGKEIGVFAYRTNRVLKRIDAQTFCGKFSGATGTFGAHYVANSEVDWLFVAKEFVEKDLGLEFNQLTTQIESHDWNIEIFNEFTHLAGILHNLATDIWLYISLGYFVQQRGNGTVGSSTMPHKINPIRFENAEANLEISIALFNSLSQSLVTTRMQRDLTDSTTQRNMGVAFGHFLLAVKNLIKGFSGLDINVNKLKEDLDNAWEVLAEPIQSIMRLEAAKGNKDFENPYNKLKEFSRGKKIDQKSVKIFIDKFPKEVKEKLAKLTPNNYVGIAKELVKNNLK